MFQFTQRLGLFVVALASFAMPAAAAWNPMHLFFEDDFVFDKDRFRGDWAGAERWKGRLCEGSYQYLINLAGKVDKLDFKLTEKEYLEAYGDLTNITGGVQGSYRSGYSLCVPLSSRLGVSLQRFEVFARVTMSEEGGELDIKIDIYHTRMQGLRFSKYIPDFLEDALTKVLDKALNYVWKTDLGDWIGEKISEKLKENFPDGLVITIE